MECSCLAADQDLDTLHECDLERAVKWRRWSLFVLCRPKDLLRWGKTELQSFSSNIATAKSISAFLALRTWPSLGALWFEPNAHHTISKCFSHTRTFSIPLRLALQMSSAFTNLSKNSEIDRSRGELESCSLLFNRIALNSSWQQINAFRSFCIQAIESNSSSLTLNSSSNLSVTCFWNDSSSESRVLDLWFSSKEWTCSCLRRSIERPKEDIVTSPNSSWKFPSVDKHHRSHRTHQKQLRWHSLLQFASQVTVSNKWKKG